MPLDAAAHNGCTTALVPSYNNQLQPCSVIYTTSWIGITLTLVLDNINSNVKGQRILEMKVSGINLLDLAS